ncbi:hypothetical protein [Streptomyces sp. CBMA152]|uniref:hypothetical protein n=1 Tax=Streptomyces sp. CBMA152 TaxID=1896312 RepID=UPI0016603965|nr:hypothetical protein [Streptomyces sp. CBMA152]MBD0743582.1 hypothetical protein [Streptomyces sp. CBMA152]
MSTADARLWEIVEQAAQAVTDGVTGRLEKKELVAELRERLADNSLMDHVRAVTLDRLAESLARGFGERRSPKPGRPSGMFHPRSILKLGDGKWIWMAEATDRDLIEWGRQSTKNLARVAVAEGARQAYVAERLEAFQTHPGWLLGRIEREVFNHVEIEDPPNSPDPDWDEA